LFLILRTRKRPSKKPSCFCNSCKTCLFNFMLFIIPSPLFCF